MTRKDYIAIAEVISNARVIEASNREGEVSRNITCDVIACDLSAILAKDNPNFNRTKFLNACGVIDGNNSPRRRV